MPEDDCSSLGVLVDDHWNVIVGRQWAWNHSDEDKEEQRQGASCEQKPQNGGTRKEDAR